jgi:hypothetical protein
MTAHIPEGSSDWPVDTRNTMPPRNPNDDDDEGEDDDDDAESDDENDPAVIREPDE